MKFLCNRRDFLADCLLVSGGVSRDGITRNIKAIVASGHCTLMATDLEIGIRLEVRVRVESDGAATGVVVETLHLERHAHVRAVKIIDKSEPLSPMNEARGLSSLIDASKSGEKPAFPAWCRQSCQRVGWQPHDLANLC